MNRKVWKSTNFVLTAWKLGTKKDTTYCMLKIPSRQIKIICQSLADANDY